MPLKMQEFLDQATHNESLLNTLDEKFPDDFFDWKITIAFYTILHYMNAYLSAEGRGILCKDHWDRNNHLNPNAFESTFPLTEDNWDLYYEMYIKSRLVRYNGIRNKVIAKKKWKQDYNLIEGHFKKLKEFVLDDLNLS